MLRPHSDRHGIEGRYGFFRPGHTEHAPGLAGGTEWPRRGRDFWLLTALYAGFLFLCDRLPFLGAVAVTLVYFAATLPRWTEHGLQFLATAYFVFSLFLGEAGGLWGAPPLLQFVLIAPLILICILPSDLKPWFAGIGRVGMILLATPCFAVVGAHYWTGLDRLLALAWTLIASRIDSVPDAAATYAMLGLMAMSGIRSNEVTNTRMAKRAFFALMALIVLRVVAPGWIAALRDQVWLLDIGVVALVLLFCLWPSKAESSPAPNN